jgi:hypothetical protein
MTGATGRGLRGGSYTVSTTGAGTAITFERTRFTTDVRITGQASLDANALIAHVVVAGPRGRTGVLDIRAVLWDPAHPRASVRGTLGGHPIAVVTPTR